MGHRTVIALRLVLAAILAGSLFLQTVMVPLLAADLSGDVDRDVARLRLPVVVIVVLGIATVQVAVVCIWRLLTLVRRGTVFSPASFRFVDTIIVAIGTASALTFTLGVVLAPGETVAPGIVLLLGGLGVLIAGVALVVLVQRMLLAQAVERDVEAGRLRSELDEVI